MTTRFFNYSDNWSELSNYLSDRYKNENNQCIPDRFKDNADTDTFSFSVYANTLRVIIHDIRTKLGEESQHKYRMFDAKDINGVIHYSIAQSVSACQMSAITSELQNLYNFKKNGDLFLATAMIVGIASIAFYIMSEQKVDNADTMLILVNIYYIGLFVGLGVYSRYQYNKALQTVIHGIIAKVGTNQGDLFHHVEKLKNNQTETVHTDGIIQ